MTMVSPATLSLSGMTLVALFAAWKARPVLFGALRKRSLGRPQTLKTG